MLKYANNGCIIRTVVRKINSEGEYGMSNLKSCASTETFLNELMIIFQKNYCKNEKFIKELSDILLQATGNDNLGSLCREIINF
jgi:hypothetical protein